MFFRNAAEPIRVWLQNPDVIEICVNRPGELWVEALGKPAMERFEVPELTETAIRRLAEHVASITQQSVNSSTPLLSAAMPHGERFQGVLAPAAPSGGAFSIRKQVIANLDLDDYAQMGAFESVKVRGPRKPDINHYPEIESELARAAGRYDPRRRAKGASLRGQEPCDDDHLGRHVIGQDDLSQRAAQGGAGYRARDLDRGHARVAAAAGELAVAARLQRRAGARASDGSGLAGVRACASDPIGCSLAKSAAPRPLPSCKPSIPAIPAP